MNLMDQTHSKIAGAGSESGVVELQVIARIPDLDAPSPSHKHKHSHSSRSRTSKSTSTSGRLLSAGLSLKLLMGLGLVLLLGAIAPYVLINFTDITQSKTGSANEQAWQHLPPSPTADLAPAWKPPATQPNVTPTPAVLSTNEILAADIKNAPGKEIEIIASPQAGKADPRTTASAQISPWPRNVDEKAEFSPWPNPAHPILAEAGPRQKEPFTADRRSGPLSGVAVRMPSVPPPKASATVQPRSGNEAGTAQFEGIINTPSDRNTYDRSRSSIH